MVSAMQKQFSLTCKRRVERSVNAIFKSVKPLLELHTYSFDDTFLGEEEGNKRIKGIK